ncbi:MAG TPA: folate-binding protein [Methylibium sp.]|uniref:CAF17-like 4Fe-4S cluster assembly/insertion protein YgfZ n=1 Tax=Methylibium sp. TaxID=2067992 RepID=UPI002DBF1AF6|nr:folate-binding protein [Methylibium sp.]HEU4460614.1 folate-binding protein [Methylibium sp.]
MVSDPAQSGPEGAAALAHSGVIRVRGADAASFLHGQLTNDFSLLGLDEARLAAYCSPKGRMLASFVACKHAHDEIRLVCRAELLPTTLKRLRMFVLRAKAQLDDAGAELALLGLAGASAQAALPAEAGSMRPWRRIDVDGADLLRLPDAAGLPRWLWIGAPAHAAALANALPALPLDAWDWLEVRSGIAPVVAATVEAFVPQMLNYELVGGVNFQKGCYPGQEVVARSQYRGTLKRRTVLLHAEAPALRAGQEVWWSGDAAQPSGLVAFAAPSPQGGHDALVEMKLAALDDGRLHLGAADGPELAQRPLPYALPRENAAA